jgi:hypothetical protein
VPEHNPILDVLTDAQTAAQERVDARRALIVSVAAMAAVLAASVLMVVGGSGL